MLIEVESDRRGEQSPLDLHRMFDLLEEPRPVSRVMAPNFVGEDVWCDVTGWTEDGPCPAMAALSEDSGEGRGVAGVRGAARECGSGPRVLPTEWDLSDAGQWGEACLMLGRDTDVE